MVRWMRTLRFLDIRPGALLGELAEVAEATLGLRAVLDRHPVHVLAMDDEPVVRLDLDTPDTLDQARKLLGVSGPQ